MDILTKLGDWFEFLWPLEIVQQWERANVYVFGRYWRTVGPGLYVKVPWFMKYIAVPVKPGIIKTSRIDITLRDDTVLSFAASATLLVENTRQAIDEVDTYKETAQEALEACLADKLARLDPAKLAPDQRPRLAQLAKRWFAAEVSEYGIRVEKVRFTTFVHRVKTIRLLNDSAAPETSW